MQKRKIILLLPMFLAACAPLLPVVPESSQPVASHTVEAGIRDDAAQSPIQGTDLPTAEDSSLATITPTSDINRRVYPTEEYRIPGQLLPFDGIRPVYDPQFAGVSESLLKDDELVMGVALDGESKAYPVSVLRFREMVNDELADWPILVSW
jgi:hypothetical protein